MSSAVGLAFIFLAAVGCVETLWRIGAALQRIWAWSKRRRARALGPVRPAVFIGGVDDPERFREQIGKIFREQFEADRAVTALDDNIGAG